MEFLIECLNQQPLIGQIAIMVGLSSILLSLGLCIGHLVDLLGMIVRHNSEKRFLKGRYINPNTEARRFSKLANEEDNDCTVLAWMVAFGVPYGTAHYTLYELFGRRNRDGVNTLLYYTTLESLFERRGKFNGKRIVSAIHYTSYNKKQYGKAKTVKDFMDMGGTWMLSISGHALTVKDGILYDPCQGNLYEKVRFATKIEEIVG